MNSQSQLKAQVRKCAPAAVVNAERFGISSAPRCNGLKIMVKAGSRGVGGLYEWTAQPVYATRRNRWGNLVLRFKNWSAKFVADHIYTRGEW